MKDKSPPPSRKNPPSPPPLTPPPGAIESGKTQEMSRAEILEYLEKMKKEGDAR